MGVVHDVRCLKQRTLLEGADRAALPVRGEDREAELVLMQAVTSFAERVPANVDVRTDARGCQIRRTATDLHQYSSLRRHVLNDEHRRRQRVDRGCDSIR